MTTPATRWWSARAARASLLVALALAPCTSPPIRAQGGAAPTGVRGTVDTVTFWSQSLGTHKRALVWLPPSYASSGSRRYPSAYYLHGMWGSETDWTQQGALHHVLDSLVASGVPEMVVVMPDGDDGWYTTWNRLLDVSVCRAQFKPRPGDATAADYCVPWSHYDDYIARDLVAFVDGRYRTRRERGHRGIAGLSMGGYGAVSLALRYPDVFSAAASHSGVLSPLYTGARPFDGTTRYAASIEELKAEWGERFWPIVSPPFGSDTSAWWSRDPARMAQRLHRDDPRRFPAFFIDCGTEDGLVDHARAFHAELRRLGVTPRYAEWPGKHDWPYWRAHAGASAEWLARRLSSS